VHSGRRFAWRYRMRRSGLAPVAAQLAVPVALGLLIGGVLAYQAGSTNNAVQPVPLGAVATPTPSFGRPSASTATGAVAPPSPAWLTPPASLRPSTATASAAPTATPTATPVATTRKAVKQTAPANASGR
jgi:hypothetical protein